MIRSLYLVAGLLLVALGVIGAFVPLLPTTIFLILATACFARSSPRLERWVLDHPRLGPPVRAWREDGAISGPSKALAILGMTIGYALFWWNASPQPPLALGVGVLMLACAAYVLSRPVPSGAAAHPSRAERRTAESSRD